MQPNLENFVADSIHKTSLLISWFMFLLDNLFIAASISCKQSGHNHEIYVFDVEIVVSRRKPL